MKHVRQQRHPSRRSHTVLAWLVGLVTAFLLYQLVATLIEELPRLAGGLK